MSSHERRTVPRQGGLPRGARGSVCGWCGSTHVADAHDCTCKEDCGVGWCCAAEDLRVVTYL